jgi:ketosteroid isomerase-like protein
MRKQTMRISSQIVLTSLAMAIALPAQAAITVCAPDSKASVVAEKYQARWLAAFKTADPAVIAKLYAESAVLMPPTDETLVGREPISGYLTAHAGPANKADYRVELVSCELRGNTLHIAGVWGASSDPASAASASTTGNIMRVLEPSVDGGWIASYEIWN